MTKRSVPFRDSSKVETTPRFAGSQRESGAAHTDISSLLLNGSLTRKRLLRRVSAERPKERKAAARLLFCHLLRGFSGLLRQRIGCVEIEIQIQNVHARFAEETELTAFAVVLNERAHLLLTHPTLFGDTGHLKLS